MPIEHLFETCNFSKPGLYNENWALKYCGIGCEYISFERVHDIQPKSYYTARDV